jgi:hypothetical protein
MLGSVERLTGTHSSGAVTDELNSIIRLLKNTCPGDADICFEFDRNLQVHIDVRKQEDVTLVQAVLPTLGGELFSGIRLGRTPRRPFCHRVSAQVDR